MRKFSKLAFLAAFGLALAFTSSCSMLDKPDKEDPPIPNKIPYSFDFEVDGTGTVYFDNQAKAVTVVAESDKTPGKITVYYEGKEEGQYPKVDVPPVDFGEYIVTFDVEAASGWDSAPGLYAGQLVIADGTPDVPSGISLAIQSPTSIKVSWSSVARATSYKVFYITEGMSEIKFIEEVSSGTSFIHTGLTEGNTYYYFIIAVNSYGESAYSEFKVIKIDAPVTPQNLQAQATGSDKITVRWGAVSGATSYKVYYGTDPAGTDKAELGTPTSNSISATGLTGNTTYYFYVIAVNSVGESDLSEAVSAKTLQAPDWYANLRVLTSAVLSTSCTIVLTWNSHPASSVSYGVNQSIGSPDNFTYVKYTGSVRQALLDCSPNTTYYYYLEYSYPHPSGYATIKGMSEIFTVSTGSYTPPSVTPTPSPALPSTPPTGASSGQKMCTTCSGSGKCHGGSIATGLCSGGYKQCSACNGKGTYNNKTCNVCNGAKKVKCGLCNGTGKCNRCNGTGKI
jgi:DnaJ-class molecular chaperone with C-terminal Zn finger domain